jgi:Secretion system C-terminal sorting domain
MKQQIKNIKKTNFVLLSFVLLLTATITHAQSRLVIGSDYLVMTGGTAAAPIYLTVNNSNTNALVHASTGHIITNNEYQCVKWSVGTNTGNFTFPFGAGTATYIPLEYIATAAGIGSGNVTLATWFTAANANLPDGGYIMCPSENRVIDRFWTIAHNGYGTNPVNNVRFYYNDPAESDGLPEANLAAQRGNIALPCPWDATVGMVNMGADYVEVTGAASNSFSPWTLTNILSPLPVTLLSFTGENKDMGNLLKWTTATESNNKHFLVQRSTDALNFETIATVATKAINGNSNTELNYTFLDNNPLLWRGRGEVYYRLQQFDMDEKSVFSNIIKLLNPQTGTLSIYPNPATDVLHIVSTGKIEAIVMYAVNGKTVLQLKNPISNAISIQHLAQGVYTIKISTAYEQSIIKFLKK